MGPILLPEDILFSNIVGFHLKHSADHDYAILASPLDEVSMNSLTHITWREFERAIHRAAYITRSALESEGAPSTGYVVSLLASTDVIVYQATILGIMRSGNIVSAVNSFSPIETN